MDTTSYISSSSSLVSSTKQRDTVSTRVPDTHPMSYPFPDDITSKKDVNTIPPFQVHPMSDNSISTVDAFDITVSDHPTSQRSHRSHPQRASGVIALGQSARSLQRSSECEHQRSNHNNPYSHITPVLSGQCCPSSTSSTSSVPTLRCKLPNPDSQRLMIKIESSPESSGQTEQHDPQRNVIKGQHQLHHGHQDEQSQEMNHLSLPIVSGISANTVEKTQPDMWCLSQPQFVPTKGTLHLSIASIKSAYHGHDDSYYSHIYMILIQPT